MKRMLVLIAGAVMVTGSAWAVPFGDGGSALQGVLDSHTVGGPSSVNTATDALVDSGDSYWQISASGGSVATMVVEMAGFADNNKFGVYNGSSYVEIFDGSVTAGAGFPQATLSIFADGQVFVNGTYQATFGSTAFGYYLDSSYYTGSTGGTDLVGGLWHSDTALNSDGMDHLAAYQGKGDTFQIPPFGAGLWSANEYVLAWEDLDNHKSPWTDNDFTDMVVMVESVNPVPEPATMVLLGSGLVGLAGMGRRRKSKKS